MESRNRRNARASGAWLWTVGLMVALVAGNASASIEGSRVPSKKVTKPPVSAAATDEKRTIRTEPLPAWLEEKVPAPSLAPAPFASGERIHFIVNIFGKRAGEGEMAVGAKTEHRGRTALKLFTKVRSDGVFESVYPFVNDGTTLLDTEMAVPVTSEIRQKMGKNPERTVELSFATRGLARILGIRTDGAKRARVRDYSPSAALDPLALIYHLRRRVMKVGDRFPLFVHNGRRLYRLDVKVAAEDDVFTDIGKRRGFRLEARVTRANGERPKWHHDMTLWLSSDERRVPLKLAFDVPLGKVEVVLDGYAGAGAATTASR